MASAPPADNTGLPVPEIPATQIGAAELYRPETVLSTSPGGATAPPWFTAFSNTLDQTRQTVERMERNQKYMSAVIENMRIAKSNVKLESQGIPIYHAKQKEVDGDGTVLANAAVHYTSQISLAPLAVAPAVGTIFSPTIEKHTLNHTAILRIIQFYNQNFDIQPGDTVPIRAQKIVNWLTSKI